MAKSPNPKSMIGFRADAAQREAIRAVANAGKISETEVLRICAPDPAVAGVLAAMAKSPHRFEHSYRSLLFAGLLSRLERAGLDTKLMLEIERALKSGNPTWIYNLAESVIEAQLHQSGDESARFEFVRAEGGDGLIPVPIGGTARIDEGGIVVDVEQSHPVLKLEEMLAGLRSENKSIRRSAAMCLSYGFMAGQIISGASELDIEHGTGKDVAKLIEAAVEGDSSAVDTLERVLTNDPSKAPSTPTEPNTANRSQPTE